MSENRRGIFFDSHCRAGAVHAEDNSPLEQECCRNGLRTQTITALWQYYSFVGRTTKIQWNLEEPKFSPSHAETS